MTAAPPQPAADTPADRPAPDTAALLTTYIELNYDLTALAQHTHVPILDLLDWLAAPDTRDRLAALRQAADDALTLRATEARRTAIDALEHVTRATDDLVEKRRAASALLRALAPRAMRADASASSPRSDGERIEVRGYPSSNAPTPQVPRMPQPNACSNDAPSHDSQPPDASPDVLTHLLAKALTANAPEDNDAGLRALHATCAPGATLDDNPIARHHADFIDDLDEDTLDALTPAHAEPEPPNATDDAEHQATRRIRLTSHRATTRTLTLRIARPGPPRPGYPAGWRIHAMNIDDPDTS